jgi:hypothetical protein
MTVRPAWPSRGLERPHGLGTCDVSDDHPRWRSHTFADGTRSLTLVGPLDEQLAGQLRSRISELIERGARRLIVDAATIDPSGDEPTLVASLFATRSVSCATVVVAPGEAALTELLPGSIAVTRTLSEARRQLSSGGSRRGARTSLPAPAGRIPISQRRVLARRQAFRWAERAAREGDYDRALSGLALVERVEGALPEDWQQRRERWLAA